MRWQPVGKVWPKKVDPEKISDAFSTTSQSMNKDSGAFSLPSNGELSSAMWENFIEVLFN